MYKVTLLPDAEKSFKKLDKPVQQRIAEKIDWLAQNADTIIHHPLVSLPDNLRGLCRMSKRDKLLTKILSGASDANIQFDGMCQLIRKLGFDERI